jgi:hypothetical protein
MFFVCDSRVLGNLKNLCFLFVSQLRALNEFLKEHRKVEEQGAIIARQQKQIEALSSGLDKVNAQLATASLPLRTAGGFEPSKPGTRTASE